MVYIFPGEEYRILTREGAPEFAFYSPYANWWQNFLSDLKMQSFLGRIYGVYIKNGFSTLFVRKEDDRLVIQAPTRDLFYNLYSYVSVYKGITVQVNTKSVRTTTRVIASSEEADFGNILVYYQPGYVLLSIDEASEIGTEYKVVELVDQNLLNTLMDAAEKGIYIVIATPEELFGRIRSFCQALGYTEIPREFIIKGVSG
ncbi:MAG TPA: hypothetical protein DHV12_04960 [Thermotogae bacterium]|nr:hypothetical protein [Thermotogota bacterium]